MVELCSNLSDERMVIVNRWYDLSKHDKYIFVDQKGTLKEKDFKTEGTDKIHFSKTSIYMDDNIKTLRHKLSKEINVPDNEIFLFTAIPIISQRKETIFQSFLDKVFSNRSQIFTRDFNMYFQDTFNITNKDSNEKYPIKFKEDTEVIVRSDINIQKKVLKEIKQINVCLSFELLNSKKSSIPFIMNPYNALSNEDRVMYKRNIIYDFNDLKDLYSFQVPKDLEIHMVIKDDISSFGGKYFTAKKDLVYDLYFPSEVITINDKKSKLINEIDVMKKNINIYDFKKLSENNLCFVTFCKFINTDKSSINIRRLFNTFKTRLDIPFTTMKTKRKDFYYRLYKHNLHDLVERPMFYKWIENERKSIVSRKNDQFTMKIRFKDTKAYASIVIRENGEYTFGINLTGLQIPFSELLTFMSELNQGVLKDIGVAPMVINQNLLIEDLKMTTMVTTKTPLRSISNLKKSFDNNPFFNMIRGSKDDNSFLLRYKRVSEFSKMDNISAFISNKIHLPPTELISEMMNEFSLDEDTATTEYNEKKDTIKLKMINENGKSKYVAKYNEGVIVEVKIVNQNQFQVNVNRMTNPLYHNNIIRTLILLSSQLNIGFDLLINQSVRKALEDYEDDSSETNEDITLGILNDMLDKNDDNNDAGDDDDDDNEEDDNESIASFDSLMEDDEDIPIIDEDIEIKKPTEEYITLINKDVTENIKPEEYTNLSKSELRKYSSRFILNQLKSADKDLFLPDYATRCPIIDKKMPVVLNKVEKMRIDANHKDSYSGFIKTGSTEELKHKNYFICPMVWCPISRTSITYEELKKNKGKCPPPYEETPISFHKEGIKKKEGDYYKYPYLMNKTFHKDGKQMVCCGYKKNDDVLFDEDEEEFIDKTQRDSSKEKAEEYKKDRYIKRSAHIPIEEDRLSTLPYDLHTLMNPNTPIDECSGFRNDKKNGCFLRRGLNNDAVLYNNQKFLQALQKTVQNPQINSIKSFVQHIVDQLTLFEYIQLNGGYTLKTFMKKDPTLFETFRLNFLANKEYIQRMNLKDIQAFLEANEELQNNGSYIEQIVQREFLIYCSWINFKNYIKDHSVNKDPETILDLMNMKSVNSKGIQYIIIDMDNEDMIYMLCPKYIKRCFDKNKPFIVLLKIQNHYEQLIKYTNDNKLFNPFQGTDITTEVLVNLYTNNCECTQSIIHTIPNEHDLVIDYSLQIIGSYDSENKRFSRLSKYETIQNISNMKHKIRYVETIQHKDIDSVKVLEDLKLFVGYEEKDKRVKKLHKYLKNERKYKNYLKEVFDKKNDSSTFRKKYVLIVHDLNPLSESDKVEDMNALLVDHLGENDFSLRASLEIIKKSLDVIENMMYEEPIIDQQNEYLFDKMDMLESTVLDSYDKSNNPYKVYNNSLEDLIEQYTVQNPSLTPKPNPLVITLFKVTPDEIYRKNLLEQNMKGLELSIRDTFDQILIDRFKLQAFTIDTKNKEASFWMTLNGMNKSNQSMNDPAYKWGVLEIVHIVKQLNSGLILLSKTKSDPLDNQLKIVNNIEILIHHPDQYMIIVYRKKTNSFHFVMNINSQTLIHRRENLSEKMNMYIDKRNVPPKSSHKKFLNEYYNAIG